MIEATTLKQLEAPFAEVGWKVQATNAAKDKGMVVAYIDARDVARRLDECGLEWSDSYTIHAMSGTQWIVECRLTVNGVTRVDVGTGEGDEAAKSAYSDAFKRAAVKFGVGRYLYDIPTAWMPIEHKQLTKESLEKLNSAYQRKYGAKPQAQQQQTQQAIEPAPAPQPAKPATRITPEQLKAIATALRHAGFDGQTEQERADARWFLAHVLGVESIPDVKQLSGEQAQVLTELMGNWDGGKYRSTEQQLAPLIEGWYHARAKQAS
jgi:hypothetical protein